MIPSQTNAMSSDHGKVLSVTTQHTKIQGAAAKIQAQ